MFIFADESGNTGRAIFNEPVDYHLGALLCTYDANDVVKNVIDAGLLEHSSTRLHAHELTPPQNSALAHQIMDALDDAGNWTFSVTIIEKPYIATTKFVDLVFDSGENGGVPWIWYNNDLFRHQLCVAIDDILTDRNRSRFWSAFLEGNLDELRECVRNAQTYISRNVTDVRLSRVIRDGFEFFLRYTDEFGVGPHGGRRSYQGHTPNMVAFSSLLIAVNRFAEANHSLPIAFVHDRQDEFRTTMREWHGLFGPMVFDDDERGGWPQVRRVAHELPNLEIISSADSPSLQAVDNLLWIARRRGSHGDVKSAQRRLFETSDEYFISRWMSEMIVFMRMRQVANTKLSDSDLARASRLMSRSEEERQRRLRRGGSGKA